eukprot:CAMPEP_0117665106 /NCGR_PEP_ID=MMETSP0804-20121206/9620_1 /TAXON_ID=1074897 /ORGANISM="Tetraselmis astigmatica, Strain CCMP880" /LENGTH=145 /DNA_ID=CAMNT_0005472471 /DNA_START=209 /DNA_END=643 /DNA_ORIENTATION=+
MNSARMPPTKAACPAPAGRAESSREPPNPLKSHPLKSHLLPWPCRQSTPGSVAPPSLRPSRLARENQQHGDLEEDYASARTWVQGIGAHQAAVAVEAEQRALQLNPIPDSASSAAAEATSSAAVTAAAADPRLKGRAMEGGYDSS